LLNPSIADLLLKSEIKEDSKKLISCHPDPKTDLRRKKRIQKWLSVLTECIQDSTSEPRMTDCSYMRRLYHGCISVHGDFHLNKPLSSGEFVTYLLSILNVTCAEVKFTKSDTKTNEVISENRDSKALPLWNIPLKFLHQETLSIEELFDLTELHTFETPYKGHRTLNVTQSITSDLIIFFLRRNIGSELNPIVSKTRINIVQSCRSMELFAIVNYHMNHYTCFVFWDHTQTWYFYDDRPGYSSYIIISVGHNLNSVIEFSQGKIFTQSELLFYRRSPRTSTSIILKA
jgi:hypothetical protein